MAERQVNFDRGVMIQKEPLSGMRVYMYIDEPGHYLNYAGKEIPEVLAKKAGFDTELYGKLRFKKEKLAEVGAAMERELELAEAQSEAISLEKRGGYELIQKGPTANVIDLSDGSPMTAKPMTIAEARLMMEILAPKKAKGKGKADDAAPAA